MKHKQTLENCDILIDRVKEQRMWDDYEESKQEPYKTVDFQLTSRKILLYRLTNIIIECKKIPERSDLGECDEFCVDRDLSLTEVFKIARGDYDKFFHLSSKRNSER